MFFARTKRLYENLGISMSEITNLLYCTGRKMLDGHIHILEGSDREEFLDKLHWAGNGKISDLRPPASFATIALLLRRPNGLENLVYWCSRAGEYPFCQIDLLGYDAPARLKGHLSPGHGVQSHLRPLLCR